MNNGLYLQSSRTINITTSAKTNYAIICVAYILDLLCVTSLRRHQLMNEKKLDEMYKFTIPLVYVFGIIIGKIHLVGKSFLNSLLIFSVLLYYSLFSKSAILYIILEHLQFGIYNLIRYNHFYIMMLANTHTVDDFKSHFPYICIVSNFGNVIEIQGLKLLSKFNTGTNILLVFSASTLILGFISKIFVVNQIKVKRDELYADKIKWGRGILQSIYNGCCIIQYNVILKMTQFKIKPTRITDIIVIIFACGYFYLNKHMVSSKHMKYMLYAAPFSILLLNCMMLFDDNTLNCIVYFGIYCIRFMIHDLSRYKMYLQHSLKVIFEYVILDTCVQMICEYIIVPNYTEIQNRILSYGTSCVYFITAFLLSKHLSKDEEMIRCIHSIETNT